jgi:hypothetical protein
MNQNEINYHKRVHLEPLQKPDSVRINTHNSHRHELAKALVVYIMKKRKYEVYTEAKWGNGWRGIADVYVPGVPCYIEILESETDEMLNRKVASYPKITQIIIRVGDLGDTVMEWYDNLRALLPEVD